MDLHHKFEVVDPPPLGGVTLGAGLREPLGGGRADKRANPPPVIQDDQVLLRLLMAQATQKGDTLAKLSQALGVTYERLAQWRRQEGDISRAQRSVHENAALYLRVPVVLVLALAGTVSVSDFVWPARESLSARVGIELERLRLDPYLAAFVFPALAKADPAVQLLVAFMYRELKLPQGAQIASNHWMTALHQAARGHAEGLQGLEKLRAEAKRNKAFFRGHLTPELFDSHLARRLGEVFLRCIRPNQ